MNDRIVHSGVVEHVSNDRVQVRIVQSSACGSCHIAAHCNLSEQKRKLIDVPRRGMAVAVREGDKVTVAATTKMGTQAVVLAFVFPFLLMVGVIFCVSRFTTDEPTMALSGLASLIPYYIILYACRRKIAERIAFEILIN